MSKTDALFGPPPLFDGEDPKTYDQMQTEISTAVGQRTFWIKSCYGTTWTTRWRCPDYAGSRST
jgi:hypothetical protein